MPGMSASIGSEARSAVRSYSNEVENRLGEGRSARNLSSALVAERNSGNLEDVIPTWRSFFEASDSNESSRQVALPAQRRDVMAHSFPVTQSLISFVRNLRDFEKNGWPSTSKAPQQSGLTYAASSQRSAMSSLLSLRSHQNGKRPDTTVAWGKQKGCFTNSVPH